MNNWNTIWNSFCDVVAQSVKKKNLEYEFEKEIAVEFLRTLDWYKLNQGLKEQYPVKFATATHYADFALFISGREYPEIIVELKRPKNKKDDKNTQQLLDYMDKKKCSFGILMLGNSMEVYYIDYNTPGHDWKLVEVIKYIHDNEAAHQFMEVLNRSEYSSAKMLEYCHKRVKVNKSVEYWCSEDGKTEILNMIVERSQLPEHLLDTLRSTLLIDVKRKDGLSPVVTPKVDAPVTVTPKEMPKKDGPRPPKVWMVPASPLFFDHKACFDELGCIYWKQYNNLQAGDIGYLYISHPRRSIVYKFEVVACDLPYSLDVEKEKKYYKKLEDLEKAKEHNRFYLMKRIGEHNADILTLENMMHNGLKRAPQGTLNLSDASFEKLLAYIEKNF